MNKSWIFALFAIIILALCQIIQATDKPNIVYFLIDDMGFSDCGFNGGKNIKTPNIDSLAQCGTIFANYYVQPLCSTSRACLMTGRLPIRHGIYGALKTDSKFGLPLNERLLPQALHEAGYITAICGKWHLGEFQSQYRPMQRGYDHQYGLWYGMIDYFTHERGGRVDWYRDDQPLTEDGYSTHLIAREAVRLISRQSNEKPIFLYVAFNAVHAPFQVPDKYQTPYRNLPPKRRTMAGMLSAVDEAIGQIIQALTDSNLRDNTLIIFSSDNGGVQPDQYTSNQPLRDGKGSIYEGGVRSAAFAVWPDKIPAGKTVQDPVHLIDWYPTLLKLTGVSPVQSLPVDGVDIMPLLQNGTPLQRDALLLAQPNQAAIRMGDWKLIQLASGKIELYNLAEDIGETHNLATEHPQQAAIMNVRLKEMLKDAVPPLTNQSRPDDSE